MKKFTSLMLMLLCAVTTWGQDVFSNDNLKEITPGNYLIYYTDANSTKHYLQTTGVNAFATVTENPTTYEISVGGGDAFSKAYYIKMNNLCFSNPDPSNNHTLTTGTIGWNATAYISTAVFENGEGLCALRSTNAAVTQWDENYFITHDESNNVIAIDGAVGGSDLFVWTIEEAEETEPEYITNAKAILAEAGLETIALQVKDQNAAGYIWANTYAAGDEGVIDYLVDGKTGTFFHTSWSSYATDGTKDYLEVDLGADNSIKNLVFDYVTRHNGQTDFPQSVTIKGSNDKSVYEDIATISEGLPIGNTKTYASDVLTNGKEYRYIRFQVNSTSRNNATIPYFHLAEINFYKVADDFTNDYITELTGINRAVKNPEATEATITAAVENYNMASYPNTLAGFTNTKCYTVTTKNRGGWAVNNEGTFVSYNQAGEIGDDYKKFAILTIDNENYYLFNVGANKFVKYDCTTVEGPGTTIAIADASAQGAKRIRVNFNAENAYININSSKNMDVCYWSAIDEGNAVLFTPAGDFDSAAALEMLAANADAIALAELIEEIEGLNITSGTNIGDYTEATVSALTAALATAKAVTEATEADVEALQAAYDALAINLPATNKVYAFNVYYNGFGTYMYSKIDGSSTNIYTRGESKDDTKALWQFVAVEGGYNIKNVHTGLFIGEGVTMTDNANNYALFEVTKTNVENGTSISAEEGKVFVKFAGETNYNCLHSYNRETVISWQGSGLGNQIGIEEVSEFSHTLTVSAAGYATLVLGFNATIPAGVECYYAAEAIDANGILNLTQVEGNVLPANTPVIVKAAANDYEFAYTTEAGNAPAANLLSGTLYTKVVTPAGTAYVLANGVNGIGLYKAELTSFIDNTGTGQTVGVANSFQNNANKVYLDAAASTAASYSFNFDWAGTTGVEGVVAEGAQNGKIYDITGREVKAITAPGLYIINGVKVVK